MNNVTAVTIVLLGYLLLLSFVQRLAWDYPDAMEFALLLFAGFVTICSLGLASAELMKLL